MFAAGLAETLTQWVLVSSLAFIFTLMLLGSIPNNVPQNAPRVEARVHLLDFGHEAVRLEDGKMPGVDLPGGSGHVWRWADQVLSGEDRAALAMRVAVEAEWVRDDSGVWKTENLLGQSVTMSEDPRGSWVFGEWPTEAAKRAAADDNTAAVSARSVWGPMGENTVLEFSDELGYRVVKGEYMLDGLATGMHLRAVLDGGVVVYADGWCHTPVREHTYEKPSVQEVLSVWNRTAKSAHVQAVRWTEGYCQAAGTNGVLYLVPAYIFIDRDGERHPVCAIDPSVIRLHAANKTESTAV